MFISVITQWLHLTHLSFRKKTKQTYIKLQFEILSVKQLFILGKNFCWSQHNIQTSDPLCTNFSPLQIDVIEEAQVCVYVYVSLMWGSQPKNSLYLCVAALRSYQNKWWAHWQWAEFYMGFFSVALKLQCLTANKGSDFSHLRLNFV